MDRLRHAAQFLFVTVGTCAVVLTGLWLVSSPPERGQIQARGVTTPSTITPSRLEAPTTSEELAVWQQSTSSPLATLPQNAASEAGPPPSRTSSSVPSSPTTTQPSARPARIRVIGDSLSVGATGAYEALEDLLGIPVTVDARVGRPTSEGIEHLRAAPLATGETLVFALGTNDGDDYMAYSAQIERTMALVPKGTRVVWLTVWRRGPLSGINQALRDALGRHPDLVVADWVAELSAHPEYLVSDNVHFTREGSDALAAFALNAMLR